MALPYGGTGGFLRVDGCCPSGLPCSIKTKIKKIENCLKYNNNIPRNPNNNMISGRDSRQQLAHQIPTKKEKFQLWNQFLHSAK